MKDYALVSLFRKIITTIFFVGCTCFVVFRAYKCFLKFTSEPQSNRISYQFNGRVTFPSISFCPLEKYQFKLDVLKKCQLKKDEYETLGQWIGKSNNTNCTDPKILYKDVTPKFEDLNVKLVRIKTFKRKIYLNSTLDIRTLTWNLTQIELRECFELTMPDHIRDEGISELKLEADFEQGGILKLHLHRGGGGWQTVNFCK